MIFFLLPPQEWGSTYPKRKTFQVFKKSQMVLWEYCIRLYCKFLPTKEFSFQDLAVYIDANIELREWRRAKAGWNL